jgi:hypothetical protein
MGPPSLSSPPPSVFSVISVVKLPLPCGYLQFGRAYTWIALVRG